MVCISLKSCTVKLFARKRRPLHISGLCFNQNPVLGLIFWVSFFFKVKIRAFPDEVSGEWTVFQFFANHFISKNKLLTFSSWEQEKLHFFFIYIIHDIIIGSCSFVNRILSINYRGAFCKSSSIIYV